MISHFGDENRQRWQLVVNNSGEEIPAFGVCMSDNVIEADSGAISLTKPNDSGIIPAIIWFNGPAPIPVGSYGAATQHLPARAKFNGALVSGYCGTVASQWYLAADDGVNAVYGFLVHSPVAEGTVYVSAHGYNPPVPLPAAGTVVSSVTQDPVTKDITVTTKTLKVSLYGGYSYPVQHGP